MNILSRTKQAVQIFLHGKDTRTKRNPIPPITLEEIAVIKQFFPRDKYFIYGHARSGTTLLTRLIRLHPQVHCNYQAHFFTRSPLLQSLVDNPEVESWLTRPSNRWNHGKDLSPLVLRAAADFILEREAIQSGKSVVGDKSPNTLLNGESVHLLHSVYPDARLIYIIRDGRDAAISQRIKNFVDTVDALSSEDRRIRSAIIANPDAYFHGEISMFTEKEIRLAAQGWVLNVTETEQLGKQLFGNKYLSLRYEDLLKDPLPSMKHIWDFLGVDTTDPALDSILTAEMKSNPDADWQATKAKDLTSQFQKGRRGSWREIFTPRDRQIFQEIAAPLLSQWSYEI
jgi:hypothetical protein